MKTQLSLYQNKDYNPGSKLNQLLWYFCNIIFLINPLNPVSSVRVAILRLFGAKIGTCVVIKPGVNIKYPWKLEIGNHVWIGEKVWIDNLDQVTISDNVCVSQGALLLCGNHNYKKPTFDLIVKPIVLEEGVWIGAKSTVCGGVVCKSHSVLAVGSVTAKDLEVYAIYQGVPAVKIRSREIVS